MATKNEVNSIEGEKDWHVCGLVVQVNPQKIEKIKTALLAIPYTEVPTMDKEKGKIVTVMQSNSSDSLLENMEQARNIDGVITVSLVYHQQDDQQAN